MRGKALLCVVGGAGLGEGIPTVCLGVVRGSPNMCRGSWVGGVALLNVGGAKLDGVALLCVCMGW